MRGPWSKGRSESRATQRSATRHQTHALPMHGLSFVARFSNYFSSMRTRCALAGSHTLLLQGILVVPPLRYGWASARFRRARSPWSRSERLAPWGAVMSRCPPARVLCMPPMHTHYSCARPDDTSWRPSETRLAQRIAGVLDPIRPLLRRTTRASVDLSQVSR